MSLRRAISISVVNQVVSSGTNFALGLYLVRTLIPTEFGLYGIGFAISLFYAGIGNALFVTQMVVNMPDKPPEQRSVYAANMGLVVATFCGSTILLAWLGSQAGSAMWPEISKYSRYGVGVAVASCSYLCKEFFVRHAYTARRETSALAVNVAVAAALAGFLLIQHYDNAVITATGALWIYAASHLFGTVVGQSLLRLPFRAVRGRLVRSDFRDAWKGGRWSLLTQIVYMTRAQAHILIGGPSVGATGVAYLNAARLFVTPCVMMSPALSQVFVPRLAELRTRDPTRMVRTGRQVVLLQLTVVSAYLLLLLFAYEQISAIVLGNRYPQLLEMVVAWAVYASLLATRNGAEIVAVATRRFRHQMLCGTASAGVTIAAVLWLVPGMGIAGAVLGLSLGEASHIVLLAAALRTQEKEGTNDTAPHQAL